MNCRNSLEKPTASSTKITSTHKLLAWNLLLNFWDTSSKQSNDGSNHQQILRCEVFIQAKTKTALPQSKERKAVQAPPSHRPRALLQLINMKWEGNSTGEKNHIFKSQIKPLSAERIFLASYRLPSVCVSSKGAKLWLRKTKIIYPTGTIWTEMAQKRYSALLLCKHDHTAHQFIFWPVTSKLGKKHKVQFLICFSMAGTVMVDKRKSLGWKDWQYFGQATSHFWTPGMCRHLNPQSKGWRWLFHFVQICVVLEQKWGYSSICFLFFQYWGRLSSHRLLHYSRCV